MKIVHICLGNYYIDNMSYQENALPKAHKLAGYDVSLIVSPYTFDKDGKIFYRETGKYTNKDGIPVTVLPYSKIPLLGRLMKFFPIFFNTLEEENPDILFVHGPQFFGNIHLKKYKKRHPQVKIFCDNHSDYINTPSNTLKYYILNKLFWPAAVRQIRNTVDYFWGVTPSRVEFLKERYHIPADKIGLLCMGGDDTLIDYENRESIRRKIRQKLNIGESDFVIITGGKLNRNKKIGELVKSFISLDRTDIHLIVFGEFAPDVSDVKALCDKRDNIHLLGWINIEEEYLYFMASDLGIFPGTHSVLWEQAAACGLPCIYRKWDGFDHVLVHGNCILTDRVDQQSLADLIASLIQNKTTYLDLKNGAEKARSHFLYSTIAERSLITRK